MELNGRILEIIKEKNLKQKDLAALMGVTESYVSALLSGRNKKVSSSVANLIEEKLGYSAHWILTGQEPKYKGGHPELSEVHRQIFLRVEKVNESEARAILAFIRALDEVKKELPER